MLKNDEIQNKIDACDVIEKLDSGLNIGYTLETTGCVITNGFVESSKKTYTKTSFLNGVEVY